MDITATNVRNVRKTAYHVNLKQTVQNAREDGMVIRAIYRALQIVASDVMMMGLAKGIGSVMGPVFLIPVNRVFMEGRADAMPL